MSLSPDRTPQTLVVYHIAAAFPVKKLQTAATAVEEYINTAICRGHLHHTNQAAQWLNSLATVYWIKWYLTWRRRRRRQVERRPCLVKRYAIFDMLRQTDIIFGGIHRLSPLEKVLNRRFLACNILIIKCRFRKKRLFQVDSMIHTSRSFKRIAFRLST